MGLNVSVNGRPVRSPVVRVLAALVTVQLVIVAVIIAAVILIPLVGAAIAIGIVGVSALLLSAPLRRRFRHRPKAPPATATATLDEDDKVARAKPVERL